MIYLSHLNDLPKLYCSKTKLAAQALADGDCGPLKALPPASPSLAVGPFCFVL